MQGLSVGGRRMISPLGELNGKDSRRDSGNGNRNAENGKRKAESGNADPTRGCLLLIWLLILVFGFKCICSKQS